MKITNTSFLKKNNYLIKLILAIILLVISISIFIYPTKLFTKILQFNPISPIIKPNPQSLWNRSIISKYDDGPRDFKRDIKSETQWYIPPDPNVIRARVDKDWFRSMMKEFYPSITPPANVDEVWNSDNKLWINLLNKFVNNYDLGKEFYNFFYFSFKFPVLYLSYDVNNDSKDEAIFISIGVGCASCHMQYIDIMTQNGELFSLTTNDGAWYHRKDGKGFYVYSMYTGNEFSTCCPNNTIVSKYEWNGSGFTEIARKKINFK